MREIYHRSLYNWNLLQYLGQDPASFDADYRRTLGFSLGGSSSQSRSCTEFRRSGSRRSESHVSRRSRPSTVQPSQPRAPAVSQTGPAVHVVPSAPVIEPSSVPPIQETVEDSGDSESVSKRPRMD